MNDKLTELFEPVVQSVEFCPVSREQAGNLVATKLNYLRKQGVLTVTQVDLVINLLPHCNIEDMLQFYAGYQGLITDTIWDK